MKPAKDVKPIIQKLREFVEDGNDGTFGTVAMHGSSVIGGLVSALLAEIEALTREREKWEKRARKVVKERKALRKERDAARVVTDAMINKGWLLLQTRCIEEYKGLLDLVERDDFADAITAALTQEDA
jgi:hypothetical protein